jgi:hypothetical protein
MLKEFNLKRQIMKKLIIIPLLVFAIISVSAKNLGDYDYVITKDGTYYCELVKVGLINLKGITQNGAALKVNLNEVRAYKSNGKIFEKMPVFEENNFTGNYAFMELIGMKDGMKLFRQTAIDNTESVSSGYNQFFVFKNDEYVLQVSNTSCDQLFKYFNVGIK